MDDHTILAGLFNLSHNNCTFITMFFVKPSKFLERIVAGYVGVEDKKRGVVFSECFLSKLEGSCCAERFRFDREMYANIVFLFVLY